MEIRTWEEMKRDNQEAAWINKDGGFCDKYKRTIKDPEVSKIVNKENVPEYKKHGFNEHWSCDNIIECFLKGGINNDQF